LKKGNKGAHKTTHKNLADITFSQPNFDEAGLESSLRTPGTAPVRRTHKWGRVHPLKQLLELEIHALLNGFSGIMKAYGTVRQTGSTNGLHLQVAQIPLDI
jgi:hypothetical protein